MSKPKKNAPIKETRTLRGDIEVLCGVLARIVTRLAEQHSTRKPARAGSPGTKA